MSKRDENGLPLEMPSQAGLWLWHSVGDKYLLFNDGKRIAVVEDIEEIAVLFLQIREHLRAAHHPAVDHPFGRPWRPSDPDHPSNSGPNN